jgi:triosephosphate isomerase (TIM)
LEDAWTEGELHEIESIAALATGTQPHVDVLICPPASLLAAAARTAAGRIGIGGQDCHPEASGAHTGDVSAEMLKDAGASAVIVGHSERRQHHGETDVLVARKALAARRAGLVAILCVGETQQQRASGAALTICGGQIVASVPVGMTASALAIGYEPLWAIGSGQIRPHKKLFTCMRTSAGVSSNIWAPRARTCASSWRLRQALQRPRDPRAT